MKDRPLPPQKTSTQHRTTTLPPAMNLPPAKKLPPIRRPTSPTKPTYRSRKRMAASVLLLRKSKRIPNSTALGRLSTRCYVCGPRRSWGATRKWLWNSVPLGLGSSPSDLPSSKIACSSDTRRTSKTSCWRIPSGTSCASWRTRVSILYRRRPFRVYPRANPLRSGWRRTLAWPHEQTWCRSIVSREVYPAFLQKNNFAITNNGGNCCGWPWRIAQAKNFTWQPPKELPPACATTRFLSSNRDWRILPSSADRWIYPPILNEDGYLLWVHEGGEGATGKEGRRGRARKERRASRGEGQGRRDEQGRSDGRREVWGTGTLTMLSLQST